MFVTLIDEKAGTELPAILVENTHDGSRGTIVVFDPVSKSVNFVPRIPNGVDNAYVDDDGKHGQYFRSGDPASFSTDESEDDTEEDELTDENLSNTGGF